MLGSTSHQPGGLLTMCRIVIALPLLLAAGSVGATTAQVPEPSILGLVGLGAVAGILAWRMRRNR
jgi:hypothetical protein